MRGPGLVVCPEVAGRRVGQVAHERETGPQGGDGRFVVGLAAGMGEAGLQQLARRSARAGGAAAPRRRCGQSTPRRPVAARGAPGPGGRLTPRWRRWPLARRSPTAPCARRCGSGWARCWANHTTSSSALERSKQAASPVRSTTSTAPSTPRKQLPPGFHERLDRHDGRGPARCNRRFAGIAQQRSQVGQLVGGQALRRDGAGERFELPAPTRRAAAATTHPAPARP